MSKYDTVDKMVDSILEQKSCPKGYHWWKIQQKCVPGEASDMRNKGKGLGRGGGKGPMGKPQAEAEEVKVSDVPKDKQKIFKINRGKAREKGGPLTKAEKGGKPHEEMFAVDNPELERIENIVERNNGTFAFTRKK